MKYNYILFSLTSGKASLQKKQKAHLRADSSAGVSAGVSALGAHWGPITGADRPVMGPDGPGWAPWAETPADIRADWSAREMGLRRPDGPMHGPKQRPIGPYYTPTTVVQH